MGGPDHLGPFLRFVDEELAELGGPERKRRATEIGKARLDFGISEGNRDLAVELIDDRGWRIPGRADTEPVAGLVARHECAHGRDVRQRLRPRCGGHRERAQLAGPDIRDRSGDPGNEIMTCPPSRSANAGPAPRYGT